MARTRQQAQHTKCRCGVRRVLRVRRRAWPLLAPAVTVNVVLALVGSFTLYNTIYVLTDGLYGTQTLGMLAFNSAFNSEEANIGYGAAVTVVLFVLTLIVAIPAMLLLRYRERRLLGGVLCGIPDWQAGSSSACSS